MAGRDSKKAEFAGAMLAGISSRSSATSKVHRSFRDGYASEGELSAAFKKDLDEIASMQKGFAFASAGQVDWLDIFRPIAKSFAGFEKRASAGDDAIGPVTRWFRTNTFYRKPLVSGKIDCEGDELAGSLPDAQGNGVVFVPAPYAFSRLVENSFYKNEEELAADYARAVSKSAKELKNSGYSCMLLLENCVGYEISKGNFRRPEWFSRVVSLAKNKDMRLGIMFPMAEAAEVAPLVEDSSVDFIGIDAVFSNSLKVSTRKDVLLGVVDGSRIGVESVDMIGKTVRDFISSSGFSGRYYIGPNDRLYDVPFEAALQKIDSLASFKGL